MYCVQPHRCKDNVICYSKLLLKASFLIKLLIFKNNMYNLSDSKRSFVVSSITPYISGSKLLILFLFFRETLIKFTRLFNSGLQSLGIISFMLVDLKSLTKYAFRERKSGLIALQSKKNSLIKTKKIVLKSSRRKVLATIPYASVTNKKLAALKKEYMSLYGHFIPYKQRRLRPQLPKTLKNRFLKRHHALRGTALRYMQNPISSKLSSTRAPVSSSKNNPTIFPKLSFFIDTTFIKTRVELDIYKKKAVTVIASAKRLAAKEQRKSKKLALALVKVPEGTSAITDKNKEFSKTLLIRKNKMKRPRIVYITNFRGLKIRKKLIKSSKELQKEISKVIASVKAKSTRKPLKSLESFNSSISGSMLDWLMGLGSKESLFLGKSRVLAKYRLIKLRVRRRRFRRRRKTFIKIKKLVKRRNLRKQIKLEVSNFINPWFLNKLAQHGYRFSQPCYNLISVYSSISSRINSLKSYSFYKGLDHSHCPTPLYLHKTEYVTLFKFNQNIPHILLTTSCKVGITRNGKNKLVGFYKKISSLPKSNSNIFLWVVTKLLKVDRFMFSNSSVSALLGVLPSFYLYKAINRSDNRFLKGYYKSNFVLPNLNLVKMRKFKQSKKNSLGLSSVYSSYSLFLGSILTSWLESQVSVVILNLKMFFVNIAKSKLLSMLVKKNIRFHYKVGTGFFIKEAVQVVLLSLSLKDPVLLMG
jgi:hypothetical protein